MDIVGSPLDERLVECRPKRANSFRHNNRSVGIIVWSCRPYMRTHGQRSDTELEVVCSSLCWPTFVLAFDWSSLSSTIHMVTIACIQLGEIEFVSRAIEDVPPVRPLACARLAGGTDSGECVRKQLQAADRMRWDGMGWDGMLEATCKSSNVWCVWFNAEIWFSTHHQSKPEKLQASWRVSLKLSQSESNHPLATSGASF